MSTADPPLSETTIAELRELMSRYPQPRSALLPMLHLVQSAQGSVTAEGVRTCAELLDLSAAEVSGVATFYTMYKRRNMGEHHVGVCTNTLCAVMGGDAIFERLQDHLDIGNDETSQDGKITLERIECNAACDFAPVLTVNWEFLDNQNPDSAVDVVEALRTDAELKASRGATITSWREAERVLAGFEDGRVDEGPAAGPASLSGLQIAKEHHWQAPGFGQAEAAVAPGPPDPGSNGSGSNGSGSNGSGSNGSGSSGSESAESRTDPTGTDRDQDAGGGDD